MKCQRKLIGSCALSFGAGVLLSIFLPPVVMVCITSVVVVGAGVAMVFTELYMEAVMRRYCFKAPKILRPLLRRLIK